MAEHLKKMREEIGRIWSSSNPEETAQIPTTRELFALVDKKFETRVVQYRWYANVSQPEHIYAVADINGRRVSLQRLIRHYMDETKPLKEIKQVSFQNKCSLDCRASNLVERVGRQSVMRNRRGKRTSASNFKGVRRKVRSNGQPYWDVNIRHEDGRLYLGGYDDERYAAKVYDAAALLFFGGSAFLNFPDQPQNLSALEEVQNRYARFQNIRRRKLQAEGSHERLK